MSNEDIVMTFFGYSLQPSCLTVLATKGNCHLYTYFTAISPTEDMEHFVFAMYRNILKYNNIINREKVAIYFENKSTEGLNRPGIIMLLLPSNDIKLAYSKWNYYQ